NGICQRRSRDYQRGKKTMFRKVVLASAIALAATPAQAKLFDVTLSWNNNGTLVTENFSFNDAEEAIDVVDIDFIIDKWGQSGFNETTDTAIADIKFRGVPIQLTYQQGNKLILDIPSLGIYQEFTDDPQGDDALDQLKDFLVEKGENEILTQINKAAAASTSFDPVAGNPSSLMSTM